MITLPPTPRMSASYRNSPITSDRSAPILGYSWQNIIEQVRGQFAETLFAGRYFWRDSHKHEVDVVLERPDGLVPMEIKYQSRIVPSDTRNLLLFMEEFDIHTGILITKDRFDKKNRGWPGDTVPPAWLALLVQDRGGLPARCYFTSVKNTHPESKDWGGE